MSKLNITVADDDLDDHMLVKDALKELKIECDVNSVYNGLQLVDFLTRKGAYKSSDSPDVIILDINMPLLDGFSVLKEMKADPRLSKIPVYVLSTSNYDYDRRRALEYGATAYYSKAIVFTELKEILRKICADTVKK